MIDKNLFLYDLAVLAILKDEGHYLKEWLDYHLAAGVDHFYLYDNESSDNQAEVAKPYVEAGLVDYFPTPGKVMQYAVYNDAVKKFKFFCRYMAFIDGDEFIYPRNTTGGDNIVKIVDEVLSHDKNAASLAINWQCFGSNGQEKADYSRNVLERFTYRAPRNWVGSAHVGNHHVKSIVNPRKTSFFNNPHYALYFEGCSAYNEIGRVVQGPFNNPVTADKIVINHYYTKSWEEYFRRKDRPLATGGKVNDIKMYFDAYNHNEEFDDGILKYFAERKKTYNPSQNSPDVESLSRALIKNLLPVLLPDTPSDFYADKLETFLTCRALSSYFGTKFNNDKVANFFEELSIKAILKSLTNLSLADKRLLVRELPNLLKLPYPAVQELRAVSLQIIQQMMDELRTIGGYNGWKDYVELDYMRDFLKE